MIYHITTCGEWSQHQRLGQVRPAAFAEEGFVHASTAKQLLGTASRLFAGREDLLALAIDPTGLDVRYEDLYDAGEDFPHVYGPFSTAAVVGAKALATDSDGLFTWPVGLGIISEDNQL